MCVCVCASDCGTYLVPERRCVDRLLVAAPHVEIVQRLADVAVGTLDDRVHRVGVDLKPCSERERKGSECVCVCERERERVREKNVEKKKEIG